VAWTPQWLLLGIRVQDDDVRQGDGVVVYLDTLNNREQTYNADDRRLVFSPEGKIVQSVGAADRIESVGSLTSDGYILEIAIQWKNMAFTPWQTLMDNQVIGLDVANVDVDGEEAEDVETVWQGTPDNATDPSVFGALILHGDNVGIYFDDKALLAAKENQ
jgi:hypothetical protein